MSKIYIVIGSTGEYSDHTEWPVGWCSTIEKANALVAKLDAEAKAFREWDNACDSHDHWKLREERMRSMSDPSFSCDYTGTTYSVWTVEEVSP